MELHAGVVGLVIGAALLLLIVALARLRTTKRLLSKHQEGLETALQQNSALQKRNQELAKYQTIVDAESHAKSLRLGAEQFVADLRREGEEALEAGRRAGQQARAEASNEAASIRAQAAQIVDAAKTEAGQVVAQANRTASEIAGDALRARERLSEFERAAEAMKNVIHGYGDRYVIPTATLMDELAEQYGFAEAGQRLKEARVRIRAMALAREAATCDYVETNRRDTAIAFVLDAFNGKADSFLADSRDDNLGTLQQKLKDAFSLVNHNGQAFRRARILPDYLAVRLDELQWAVATHVLKVREKEEQRLIRERIREEERAQKEFERAQKEAIKEEELLRKAMERVQKEVARATDEQRAKYELQLALKGHSMPPDRGRSRPG